MTRAKAIKDGKPLASEHQIQSAFVTWCRANETRYPALKLAFAVPNAAKRSPGLAAWMKAEGLRRGVLDWWLPVARGGYHGLVIEFKAPGRKLTAAQQNYADALGSDWLIYDGISDWQEAVRVVEQYLAPMLPAGQRGQLPINWPAPQLGQLILTPIENA